MNEMMLNKTISTCCMAALSTLVGCDQDVAMLDEEALELEALDAEENLWEGLTFEEMAMLEREDGTDEEPVDFGPEALTAAPNAMRADLGCVRLQQWQGAWVSYARVMNLCPYTVSIKLIWRWGMDSYCRTLGPTDRYETNINNPAAYVTAIHEC